MGLILGMNICERDSCVCYYDQQKNVTETVSFAGSAASVSNPEPLHQLLYSEKLGGADFDRLTEMIGYLVQTACKYCGQEEIDRLVVTAESFDITVLDALAAACSRIGSICDKVEFISHEESFAYYAFHMHRDLWLNGVVLFDYSENGFFGCRMHMAKIKNKNIIVQTKDSRSAADVLLEALKIADRYEGLKAVEEELLVYAREVLEGETASGVYLTGAGFDTAQLPDAFLKYICNRHRVFAGQNLYVKGACYAAYDALEQSSAQFLVACRNRLPATIDMDIVERGADKIFRVAEAGTNWYSASRSVDFIVDDCDKITLHIEPASGEKKYDETVDLSDFPYRQDKTLRIGVTFEFTGDDRCNISVVDKGFGDFVQSSGKVVYKTLAL